GMSEMSYPFVNRPARPAVEVWGVWGVWGDGEEILNSTNLWKIFLPYTPHPVPYSLKYFFGSFNFSLNS
ncbi:MAG: hypothetical protein ACOC0N_08205, partial [Chroococcales cyanobacterium]